MTTPAHRHTATYTGHVQGVGFRYTAHSIARGHAVTGYVRNLSDGRVELVAEGDRHDVDDFLEAVRDRLGNHIHDERQDIGPTTGEFNSFEIHH
jgi:acylphosphatase